MASDPTEVARLDGHRDFHHAVPTSEHFLPLLYLAGLAGAAGSGTDVLIDGYAYGSLSMTAYTLGLGAAVATVAGDGSAGALPDAAPVEDSNL
jgi:4,5-DOPA dioxygenase extradiol